MYISTYCTSGSEVQTTGCVTFPTCGTSGCVVKITLWKLHLFMFVSFIKRCLFANLCKTSVGSKYNKTNIYLHTIWNLYIISAKWLYLRILVISRITCHIINKKTTLVTRRVRGDLIEVFRIIKGFEEVDSNTFFTIASSTNLRGHSLKLYKHNLRLDTRKYFFSQSY